MAPVRVQLGEIDVVTCGNGKVIFENLELIAAPQGSTTPTVEQHLSGPSVDALPAAPAKPSALHPAPVVIQHSTVDRNARVARRDLTLRDTTVPGVGHIALAERVSRADEHVAATIATDAGQPSAVAVRRHCRKDTDDVHEYAANTLVAALTERDRMPWRVIWIEQRGGPPIPVRFVQWDGYADALLGKNEDAVPVQVTLADEPLVRRVQGPPHEVSQRTIDLKAAIIQALTNKKGELKYPASVRAASILALVLLYPLTPQLRNELTKWPAPRNRYKEVWLLPLQQDPLRIR